MLKYPPPPPKKKSLFKKPSLCFQRKPISKFLLAAFGLWNLLAIGLILNLSNNEKVYIRAALFSKVVDDSQVSTEGAFDQMLEQGFLRDGPENNPRKLFTAGQLAKLDSLVTGAQSANCYVPSDGTPAKLTPSDCLARALATDVSPYFLGGKCGLDGSLKARIGQIVKGVGCCSDFNDAFILRAKSVGLRVREVNNMGHTTTEYFDPHKLRWKWIDPSFRSQSADANGGLQSAYEIRSHSQALPLHIVDVPPFDNRTFSSAKYSGYLARNNSILYWTRGINLIETEHFEEPLRRLGLPKGMVQMISLALGIRPGYLVLAPAEAAYRFRLSALLLKSCLLLFLFIDLLILLAALGWRVSRNRPFV